MGEQLERDNIGVPESRFYMWRAVFAMAHADDYLSPEEQEMLYKYLEEIPFSKEQVKVLREDLAIPQDTEEMLSRVRNRFDRLHFLRLAQALIICDGHLDKREEEMLKHLQEKFKIEDIEDDLKELRKGTSRAHKLHEIFSKAGFSGLVKEIIEEDSASDE